MRATYLQFRNPKERTPPPYYPIKDGYGMPLNRFEYFSQSESLLGSFSKNDRFDKGSIYDHPFRSTHGKVGPGRYEDNDALLHLRKKPCMSNFGVIAERGPEESRFEISGGFSRVLCPSYLPKPMQVSFDKAMHKYTSSRSRKINETFVYTHAVARTPKADGSFFSRNMRLSHSMTPEMQHVSRMQGK